MAAPYPQPGQGLADPKDHNGAPPQGYPGPQSSPPQLGFAPQGYLQQPGGQYTTQPPGGPPQFVPPMYAPPAMYAQPQMMVVQPAAGVMFVPNPMVSMVPTAPARTQAPFKNSLGIALAFVVLGWLLEIVAVATPNWWEEGMVNAGLYDVCFSSFCSQYKDSSTRPAVRIATAGLAFGIMAVLLSFTCWIVIIVALCSSGDLRKAILGLIIPTAFTSMLCMALGLSLKTYIGGNPVAGFSSALGIISWLLFLAALGLSVFSFRYPATVSAYR